MSCVILPAPELRNARQVSCLSNVGKGSAYEVCFLLNRVFIYSDFAKHICSMEKMPLKGLVENFLCQQCL
jgi:hypothetical protein